MESKRAKKEKKTKRDVTSHHERIGSFLRKRAVSS